MKTKRLFSFTLSALLAALNCAWAGTLYVDAANGMDAPDYGYSSATPVKTIQRAIDMANPSGDTILVAPGTYAPFSVLSHSGIAIKSTDGAAVTIVDGEGKERCATFENAYTMTIEGFTLRNGHATNDSPGSDPSNGGGVCYATVKQCVIVDCVADSDGGGTYGCVIFDSSISDCTATGSGGGISGVILSGSGGTYHFNRAVDCTIFGNRASGDGGGVDSSDLIRCIVSNNVSAMLGGGALARGIVEDCTICCNKAFAGGGAFTWGGTFRNCDIYGNEAAATSEYWGNGMSYSMDCGGGGVCGSDFAGRSFATFYNCDIHDNKAVRGGGALFERLYGCRVYGNTATFGGGGFSVWAFNSIIEGNTADENGGGVLGGGLYNCTVTKNTAGIAGGGVYTVEESRTIDLYSVSAYNTIVYGNTALSNADSADGYLGYWYNSCVGYLCSDLETEKRSVIFKDPKFTDAANGDYRLCADSPCIDAGDNNKVETDTDYADRERIANGKVDMGAYEYGAGPKLYAVTFSPGSDGTSKETLRRVEKGKALGTLPSVTVTTKDSGWDGAVYRCTFKGWFTKSLVGGDPVTASTIITEDVTFYAQYEWVAVPNASYTATFNANGGKGGKSIRLAYGAALTAPAVTRTGYTLKGWEPTVPKTMPIGNKTYTAQWKATTYKIAFNANGGSGWMSSQFATYDKSAPLRKNTFTRTGWVFLGWAKSKTGAVAYKNAQSVKNLRTDGKTTTLYAVWAKKTYKVSFQANGGSGRMSAQSFTYGQAKKLSANKFKRTGYVFKGWAKSAKLAKQGKVAYANKKSIKNLDKNGKTVKLYAVWKKK